MLAALGEDQDAVEQAELAAGQPLVDPARPGAEERVGVAAQVDPPPPRRPPDSCQAGLARPASSPIWLASTGALK